MKILNLIFLSTVLMVSAVACGNDEPETPTKPTTPEQPSTPGDGDDDEITLYPWEESRTAILDYTDMVLFYGGGAQRYIPNWDKDRIESYVTYTNEQGVETWFFDAFLFLEFADYGEGSNMVSFATGYKDPSGTLLSSATKYDWENLINYFFSKGHQLYALDETIGDAISRLGAPAYKRRVVITIPEPIRNQDSSNASSSTTYWGRVSGVTLDFSRDADRVKACKWYIDRVRQLFDRANFQNIELAGFYWIAEKSTHTSTILPQVADYLHKFKYTFNWIPYYTADGYAQWSQWGFDYAYLQPNYFFNESVPESRLQEACRLGAGANMGMEMEFDDNALASRGRAYRLRNYMNVFKQEGVWANKRLAYYQHNNTVHTLRKSGNADDRALYHEFATFVTTRPLRR